MHQFADLSHPLLALVGICRLQLVFDGFSNELPKRDSVLRRFGLRRQERLSGISGVVFTSSHIPILWEPLKSIAPNENPSLAAGVFCEGPGLEGAQFTLAARGTSCGMSTPA